MAQKQRCMYSIVSVTGSWGSWQVLGRVDEAAKGCQHLQARKRTRDSDGSRRHSLQSRRESVGVSDPEAASTVLGLRANASPRSSEHSQTVHSEGWEVSTYGIGAVGRMVTFSK